MPQSWGNHKWQKNYSYILLKKTSKNLWFFPIVSQKDASSHSSRLESEMYNLCKSSSYISSFEESVSKAALFLVSPCLPLQWQGLSVKPVFRAERGTHFHNWHTLMYTHFFGLLKTVLVWNIIQKKKTLLYRNKMHTRPPLLHTLGFVYDG